VHPTSAVSVTTVPNPHKKAQVITPNHRLSFSPHVNTEPHRGQKADLRYRAGKAQAVERAGTLREGERARESEREREKELRKTHKSRRKH